MAFEPQPAEHLKHELRDCHDCGAKPGTEHIDGCDNQVCRYCGCQIIGCACPPSKWRKPVIWSGEDPFVTACIELGLEDYDSEFGWEAAWGLAPGHSGWVEWDRETRSWKPGVLLLEGRDWQKALADRRERRNG